MGNNVIKGNSILSLIVTFLVASTCIFYGYSWGKYVLIGCAAMVFLFGYAFKYEIRYMHIKPFHIMLVIFALYCSLTAFWAWDMSLAMVKAYTVLQMILCYSLLYCYYETQTSIESLFNCIRWGGYIICIYSFFAYGGLSSILEMIESGVRLDNEFNNVNTIAMMCSIACVLEFYRVIYNKIKFSTLLTVPCVIMLAALQSRKAIIMLVLGVIVLLFLKNYERKPSIKSLIKIIISFLVVWWALSFLMSLDIFSGLRDRLLGLIGESEQIDHSSVLRAKYVELGWEQFKKTPLFGIGMDCSSILTSQAGYAKTYLHNNFVELLACGGIVGFLIYYAIHAYLIYGLIKYYRCDKRRNSVCLTILLIMLIMDIGMVSYYDKITYFYFMVCFLQVEKSKKQSIAIVNGNV